MIVLVDPITRIEVISIDRLRTSLSEFGGIPGTRYWLEARSAGGLQTINRPDIRAKRGVASPGKSKHDDSNPAR
jgi:hypothetical protein